MHFDKSQLAELALTCPWWMFNGEEIAELCNVSITVVSRVKGAADSPFFLNKCRPEWFMEWMRSHPSFQLDRGSAQNLSKKIDPSLSQNIEAGRSPSKTVKGRPKP